MSFTFGVGIQVKKQRNHGKRVLKRKIEKVAGQLGLFFGVQRPVEFFELWVRLRDSTRINVNDDKEATLGDQRFF